MKKILLILVIVSAGISIGGVSAQSSYEIPAWVKGIAGFWAEGNITDSEFGEGLTFLIDSGIITIPKIAELENRIAELEDENAQLRENKATPSQDPIPSSSTVSVSTTKPNYSEGETIVISGKVSLIIGNTPLTIQMFTEGDLVDIAQVKIMNNGSYSHTVLAEGPLWNEQGDYEIRVSYGIDNVVETTFSYTPNPKVTTQSCDESYPDVCIAPYPPDLNCGDIMFANFRVLQPDPHGFDRDRDGIGCES